MAKPCYLKTRNVTFKTKVEFGRHLQSIYHKIKNSEDKMVTDLEDIYDLIDYLEDYHNDRETLPNEFNLENCEFFVDKSPDYRNSDCFWLRDKNSLEKRHFSITKFHSLSTPIQNLVQCFDYLIREIKKQIRIDLCEAEDKSFEEYNLWHKKPTMKKIVEEFIKSKELESKIDEIISPNGGRNNVPYLMEGYKYLEEDFLQFYQDKKDKGFLSYELKKRNCK